MRRHLLRLLIVSVFAVAAATPLTASAGGGGGGGGVGMMVTIGSPITLADRLLVTVPVTVACTTPLTFPFNFGGVSVFVEQASGRSVSNGGGFVNLTSCTQSPQTVLVQVTPSLFPSASAPFHGGPAIVTAFGSACDQSFTCDAGSAGPISVRL